MAERITESSLCSYGDPGECSEAPPAVPSSIKAPVFTPGPFVGRAGLAAAIGKMEIADGKIVRVTLPGGKVVSGSQWERDNMVLLKGLPSLPNGGKAYVNKVIAEPLKWVLAEWAKLGDGYVIKTFGSFAPRGKRSNPDAVSLHSPAIAFDINPQSNGMILNCPAGDPRRKKYDIPDKRIAIAKAAGFFWGGDFKTSFDPMHFQWARGV